MLHDRLVVLMPRLELLGVEGPRREVVLAGRLLEALDLAKRARLLDPPLHFPLALQLGDELGGRLDELLVGGLVLRGLVKLLKHHDVPWRRLLHALDGAHQRGLGEELLAQGPGRLDACRIRALELRVVDGLGEIRVHDLEVVQVRDHLHLHRLPELDLALKFRLDLPALVHQLAADGLVLGFEQGLGDDLQLVEVHGMDELVFGFLHHVLHLGAPCHGLLLLRRIRGLVHEQLRDRRLAERVQRP
mmetsp:Transcript_23586/g.47413  ORF Transcript_23586/g.47413 Transcript_23586/m.47413 type:complete len:246 (-) Transcript_23586:691-1428(-)